MKHKEAVADRMRGAIGCPGFLPSPYSRGFCGEKRKQVNEYREAQKSCEVFDYILE
jgi:hypothetical protein